MFFYSQLSTQAPLEALQEKCNTTTATNSHVVLQLEHAQSLLLQFSEGLTEVSPWLEETQTLVGQLSLSTISYEAFREQQDLLQVKKEGRKMLLFLHSTLLLLSLFTFLGPLILCLSGSCSGQSYKLLYNRLNVYVALWQSVENVKKM